MKKILLVLGVVVLGFILASSVITKVVYDQAFPGFERPDDTINATLRYEDIEADYERETVTFTSLDNTLQGYLYPQETPHGLVVIAHGLGGGADSYIAYAKWFLDAGWAVFMYDGTGSFDSEGKTTRGFPQALIDIENALEYIDRQDDLKTLDRVLFGHSWGGYAVANAPHVNDSIKAIASVAAPAHADTMIFEQSQQMLGLFAHTQKPFIRLYQRLLFNEYAGYDAIDAINKNAIHTMVIHGVNDETIAYDGSAIIARRDAVTNENAVFVTRDTEGQDDHTNLMRSQDALEYLETLNTDYRALYDTHDGEIPYSVKQTFYENVDRVRAQELDGSLMTRIDALFKEAIAQ